MKLDYTAKPQSTCFHPSTVVPVLLEKKQKNTGFSPFFRINRLFESTENALSEVAQPISKKVCTVDAFVIFE